ncbi:hypothetical protein [Streptomyces rubiginosohelvolus]|uniref:hypothetical protein n=1 Tax=Streptomyces rubiginosohelvolus TaxID=67362 RepID=UPI00371E63FA
MRWIRGRRAWFPYALAGGVLALAVAGTVVWFSADRAQQRADNLRQLDRACAGLLPGERLRGFVPADGAGVLEEYGTMLDPGQESRALLNCTLSWGSGRWEPTHRVRIRAEAQIAAQVEAAEAAEAGDRHISDFPLPLPPGVTGGTGADDRVEGSEVSASLRVECPGGLRGRKAPSRTLQVSVELPSKADSDHDVPAADHLLAARTAVATANWVTERQKCGAKPIRTDASPRPAAGPAPTKLCAWLDPGGLEFAQDTWEFSGDGAYNRRAGFCSGRTTGYGAPPGLPVVEVTAESWSGEFARGAYERHSDAGTAPGQRAPSPARRDGSVVIRASAFSPKLALWAKSECDGGTGYHRIAVTPALDSGNGDGAEEEKEVVVEGSDRKRLSADARATLDRYLAAADGWPGRTNCRATTILGEVEEWPR